MTQTRAKLVLKENKLNDHWKAARHSNEPFDLVHTDICQPLVPGYDGSRYFVAFTKEITSSIIITMGWKDQWGLLEGHDDLFEEGLIGLVSLAPSSRAAVTF